MDSRRMTSGTSKYLRKWMNRVQEMVRMEEQEVQEVQEVQMEKELMERVEEEKNHRR